MSYLNSTLSKEVLGQVTSCETAQDVWTSVHGMYASQSHARVMHLCTKLASTKKGEMAMAVYFTKMKEYVNEMAATGKKLDNDDVVSYILIGWDAGYNGVVENMNARVDPISISDLFAQPLAAEARVEGQYQAAMSVNAATRSGGSFRGRGGGRNGGRASHGGFGRGYGRGLGTSERSVCQICEKIGHSTGRCWKHFDREFKLEEKSINNASNTSGASYRCGYQLVYQHRGGNRSHHV
jgi:hypothetical protein